jgi:two-component system, chemotaxis family, CheB/CheR fusion protein
MNPCGLANAKSLTSQQPEPQQSRRALFPIVGVGASAGGLEAFTQLLKALPSRTGMAYVLVQHLDPTHESVLTELLTKTTEMTVRQVTDATPVEPNHVYVIPPNVDMIISQGILRLTARTEARGHHMPIDRFLRSLAEELGSNAIGVVLSGTASDGTLGLAAIKAEGGITFAQDEKSAKFDGMPQSAIAAGCVDLVLPPDGIAEELARICEHPYLAHSSSSEIAELIPDSDPHLKNILLSLRMANKIDFSDYKPATIKRRILRRMTLHKIEKAKEYVHFLQRHPAEVEALYEDILIHVTSFFRDPDAFEALKSGVFPNVLKRRLREEPIRIWAPGCSTGEETYSHAISLVEFLGDRKADIPIQLFGTDLGQAGIDKARAGVYPESIAADVSPQRLQRFFTKVEGGYRITKTIRDMCVFARHNLLQDPPFSRIDIISCRNVLIYFGLALQKRVMPIFHYALKPRAFLLLGRSEGILGTASDLFELMDRKHKIYCRKSTPARLHFDFAAGQHPLEAGNLATDKEASRKSEGGVRLFELNKEADRILLTKYAPVAVVINEDLEVLQSRGHVGLYLELAPGRADLNILKMAREGLLFDLHTAINKAKKEGIPVQKENVEVGGNGGLKAVNVEVIPLETTSAKERHLLIIFEAATPPGRSQSAETRATEVELGGKKERSNRQTILLSQELAATKRYLHSLVEDKEASNEELQAANEEILSSNEELQSTNEELQTAKEELESTNEELHTVNEELHNRNFELTQANNDFVNLLNSVNIAMVMLGGDLRIRRVTPQAEKLLGLIPTDLGRLITNIRPNIDVPDLEQMIAEVIKTVTVQERQVRDREGHWYSLRILPYSTLESVIEGAVLTLVDINVLKNNLEEIRLSHDQLVRERRKLEEVLRQMSCGVMIAEAPSGRLILINKQVEEILRHTFPDATNIEEYVQYKVFHLNEQPFKPEEWPLARSLTRGEVVTDEEIEYVRGDGTPVFLSVSSAPILDHEGRIIAAVITFFDLTHRKATEEVLRSTEKLAATGRLAASFGHEINNPLQTLTSALYLLGQSTRLGEPERQHLAMAHAELERMAHLTTSMLGFYRNSTSPVDVKICEVLDNVLKFHGPAIRSGKIIVEKRYDSEDVIRGFSSEITQVFSNLVGNALEALTSEGTLKLHLLASRDWGNPARRGVRVFIADNGSGISDENRRRIFEPFFTTKGEKGTGLGLWVASGIVDKHRGRIRVRSSTQPGRSGTCFAVFFPEQRVSTMRHTTISLDKSA